MTEEIYNIQDYKNLKEKLEKQKPRYYKEEIILKFEDSLIELRTKKNYYKRGYHRQESFVTKKLWNDA